MSEATHVESLKSKHAELEEAIEEENRRPQPDSVHLSELKRHKLRIKDELARLTH